MPYTIKEVCERTGLSAHTLRFYEKEGLLTDISRTSGGIRSYSDDDMESLGLICCLKNTGMPLAEIARFIRLTREGEHTLKERCEILREHREHIIAHMEETQKNLDKVTWKLNFFSGKQKEWEAREEEKQGRA